MLTGELRNQIDRIWDAFWSGGISNPLEVIEQITYLLFLRLLKPGGRAAVAQLDTLTQTIFIDLFGDPATNSKGIRKEALGEVIKLKSGEFLPATEMAETGTFPVFGGSGRLPGERPESWTGLFRLSKVLLMADVRGEQ